jgi:hypothetical protein
MAALCAVAEVLLTLMASIKETRIQVKNQLIDAESLIINRNQVAAALFLVFYPGVWSHGEVRLFSRSRCRSDLQVSQDAMFKSGTNSTIHSHHGTWSKISCLCRSEPNSLPGKVLMLGIVYVNPLNAANDG